MMVPTEQFLDALRAAVRDELAGLKAVVRQVVREELEHAFRGLGAELASLRAALELSVTRNQAVESLAARVVSQSEILTRLAETGV